MPAMALISCPDCGREVSTVAHACPQCGRPMTQFAAPLATAPLATGPEETLWHGSPSWILIFGRVVGLILTAIALPILLYVVYDHLPAMTFDQRDTYFRVGWMVIAAIVLLRCAGVALALARVKSTMYTVTNQRVIIESGLMTKSLEDIDLRTVDDTTFHQTFFDRIFKIGNVAIVSTDKVAPRFVLRGINDPRGLRELIRSHAYAATQRQVFTRST